jgi:SAM-dependent methyltransferase
MFNRKPLADELSALAYAIDGHGSMQPCPPSGLQASAIPVSLPPPQAALANATTAPKLQKRRFPTAGTVSLRRTVYVANLTGGKRRVGCRELFYGGGVTPSGSLAAWLDRFLYAHPFEGRSARRYAASERPAFGDLDDRLLDGWTDLLAGARTLLDVGSGPATFARRAAERFGHLQVIAIDPSRDFARHHASLHVARARGEALPLATGTVDLALCLSSIRHVRDRAATFRELRRVVRPGGRLAIIELDPAASRTRIAAHADHLGSPLLRRAFGPFLVRTAPRVESIEATARVAGWQRAALRDDPVQPVYILELV